MVSFEKGEIEIKAVHIGLVSSDGQCELMQFLVKEETSSSSVLSKYNIICNIVEIDLIMKILIRFKFLSKNP